MLITKLDAARRQIDAAVNLYFNKGDELAIHTLVGAAHILIIDLSKAANLASILDRYIVPDWRWKFEKASAPRRTSSSTRARTPRPRSTSIRTPLS